jgi:single-stranded-DNA-specific exonuclease
MVKIKNIAQVNQRLRKAVLDKEKIVLYGDADLDGASSVVILEETLREINAESISVYFPDRVNEGYGLNIKALDYLSSEGKFLLIILDSGITSFKEVEEARCRGIETIIIDHHQPLEEMPPASLIINVKQKNDKYPFKNFANAGLVFKLAQEILGQDFPQKKSFLELTALATIADMMEQKQDNKIFIKKGLESLENTQRTSLRVLLDYVGQDLETREKAQRMISILNASDVVNHRIEIYDFLICQDVKKIQRTIENLVKKNIKRKENIEKITEKAMIKANKHQNFVFQASSQWDASLLGAVASRISSETKKTTFIFNKGKKESRGAVRAGPEVNVVDVMQKYSFLLENFGGHPPAAGLLIENSNLKKFEQELIRFFEK